MTHSEQATHQKREWVGAAVAIAVELIRSMFRWIKGPGTSAILSSASEGTEPSQRDLDTTIRQVTNRRKNWGTLFALCGFGISAAGGVGFLVAYWSGGSNLELGGTMALALAGLGSTLVLYSHWLIARKEAVEEREILPSSSDERDATFEAFCSGKHDVTRRTLLTWIVISVLTLFAAIVVSLMRSLGPDPDPALFNTVWKRGQRLFTEDGKPMSVDSLQPGDSMTVFPEDSIGSERTQTVLVRVDERLLRLPAERANWAPKGFVAYSRVCTHAGCPVGIYEATTCLLLCPCHQSTFDVLQAAHPNGGPAARPLPQLPLYVDADGTLRAGGGFSNPPGPGFWGMPRS